MFFISRSSIKFYESNQLDCFNQVMVAGFSTFIVQHPLRFRPLWNFYFAITSVLCPTKLAELTLTTYTPFSRFRPLKAAFCPPGASI